MSNRLNHILALLIALSVTVIPPFKITPGLPYFQLIDLLLPLILLVVFNYRDRFKRNNLYVGLLVFSCYIIFTIIYNERYTHLSNYFEVYKLIKFSLVVAFFSVVKLKNFKNKVVFPVFIAIVLFNLLHYFNVFNFNFILEKYYNGGIHIKLFGLNSLGEPATKRMLGTLGNPNNNAILFLFFSILFYPIKNKKVINLLPFFVAIIMLFLCQSRTSFVALFVILVGAFVLNKETLKPALKIVSVVSVGYLVSFAISSNSYIGTIFDGDFAHNTSLMGRYETWQYLLEMIKQKPIFGYSPFKEYFYKNEIYPDNEYILMTWRYGVVGLGFYLLFLGYLFFKGLKNKKLNQGLILVLCVCVIAITALTNNTLSEPTILVFFAIVVGVFYNRLYRNEKA